MGLAVSFDYQPLHDERDLLLKETTYLQVDDARLAHVGSGKKIMYVERAINIYLFRRLGLHQLSSHRPPRVPDTLNCNF
jgi:hypothetical protein